MNYKLEFSINQMFDKNNDYDLFICSCCFALSDLLKINQEIGKSGDNSSLFFRINMGFARESYELLKSKFGDGTFRTKYLESIEDALEKYSEIDDIICGRTEISTFKEHKLNDNRNLIFHYPKKQNDYKLIQSVLKELEKDEHKLRYFEYDDTDSLQRQRFEFIEIIQYNTLFGIYQIQDTGQHERKLMDLSTLTAKIINLLNLLFVDFFEKKFIEM